MARFSCLTLALLAVGLTLAACGTPRGTPAGDSPSAPASGPAPAQGATAARVPAALLGTYDTNAAACAQQTTVSRLVVTPDTLGFYYGYATVNAVEARGKGYDLEATLYHQEGAVEVVPEPSTYRLEPTGGGIRLVSEYAGATLLVRCEGTAGRDAESAYTEIERCETIETFEESGGVVQRCPGYRGTPLFISEGDLRYDVDAGVRNDDFTTPSGFNSLGKTVEWRVRAGKPFAAIVRYDVDGPGGTVAERRSDLAVITVGQEGAPGCLLGYVLADSRPDQNTAARRLADQEAADHDCDA